MVYKLTKVPAGHPRGWQLLVDGAETVANEVELISSRWGRITYGFREGFDSWIYKMQENAVTVPFCIKRRSFRSALLLVGLLLENRPNMGGEVLCVIGGFTDPGETLASAQQREAKEEVGLGGQAKRIGGLMVTDRLFWDASEAGFGGNLPFAQKIHPKDLYESQPSEWRVREGASPFESFSKAQSLIFLPWGEAVRRTKDGIALAALAHLRRAYDNGEL